MVIKKHARGMTQPMPEASTTRLLFFLFCAGLSLPAAAEIYKCTNASGGVDFSDRPCGADATVVTPRPASGGSPTAAPTDAQRRDKTRRLLDSMEAERKEKKRIEAEAKAEKEERRENCIQARRYHQRITTASRVSRYDDEGNRIVLNDEERAASEQLASDAVDLWCGEE